MTERQSAGRCPAEDPQGLPEGLPGQLCDVGCGGAGPLSARNTLLPQLGDGAFRDPPNISAVVALGPGRLGPLIEGGRVRRSQRAADRCPCLHRSWGCRLSVQLGLSPGVRRRPQDGEVV